MTGYLILYAAAVLMLAIRVELARNETRWQMTRVRYAPGYHAGLPQGRRGVQRARADPGLGHARRQPEPHGRARDCGRSRGRGTRSKTRGTACTSR